MRRLSRREHSSVRPEDRPTYAEAVWETFRTKYQSQRFTMSSSEFHLLSGWMDKNIPLPVVLRAIDEMGGKPRTLHACEVPVEKAYGYWFQAMGGL